MRKVFLVGAGPLLAAARAGEAQRQVEVLGRAAWTMPADYKAVQQRAMDEHRRLLLSLADSMPEAAYRDRATPAQRDFVQQVHHAASGAYNISAAFVTGTRAPALADTAAIFGSRAGLKAFINAAYDQMGRWLEAQTQDNRHEIIRFFGKEIPRWQVWDEITTHTVWTAGQTVANFRKQGMAPPAFGFF